MKTKITLRMQLMQPEQQLKKVLFRRRRNSGSFIRECRYVGKNNLKEDELIGAMIISRAILAPLRRIAENAV
jgi:hypothetical protein